MRRLMTLATLCVSALLCVSVAQAQPRVGVAISPAGTSVVVRPGGDRLGLVDPISSRFDPRLSPGLDPRLAPGLAPGRDYFLRHAVRYRDGFYYRGLSHRHWDHCIWDARFGRYHYWDPYLRCYYYYDPLRLGYYPIRPIVVDPWMLWP
jgi:hypothetical protein